MTTARRSMLALAAGLFFSALLHGASTLAATQTLRIDKESGQLRGALNRETIEVRTREFLAKIAPRLGVDVHDLAMTKAEFQAPKNPASGGTWYVAYQQTYRGLRVFGGAVRLTVVDAKVVSVRADAYPGIEHSVTPRVPQETAVRSVSPAGLRPVSTELVIAPREEGQRVAYHLAWLIVMPIEKAPYGMAVPAPQSAPKDPRANEIVPVQWRYLIDADTGAILERRNIMVYDNVQGNVTGPVRPNAPADAAASQPIAHMGVQVQQGALTRSAETDASGNYTVTGLSPGAGTLTAHFTGAHVQIFNDETPDPDATHTAPVTAPATHDWAWAAPDDPSPLNVETNTFYHVNRVREWFLRGTPFDVNPNPDPMTAHVRNGPYCNASASSGGLLFGQGNGFCQDFAMCSDVVYHEYTHRIVDAVYAGSSVDIYANEERSAMNEAYADFFAGSLTNDGSNGEGCYAGRNFDTPNHRYPDDWVGEPHYDGMIFSGALWDLRAVLPPADVDSLAIRAMKRTPGGYSDYLAAVLEEDDNTAFSADPSANNDPADGTPNIDAICHTYFDLHGIFHPYCVGHITAPVALITAPPPFGFTLADPAAATLTIVGTAIAGSSSPFSHYVLEYTTESAPATWITTGVTLTGGGTSAVPAGTLGTISLGALADGVYRVRLTVFDVASTTAVAKTTFDLDRSIKTGWPQGLGTHFTTPTIADIDPATPGQEIVAAGNDGYIHAWHADGTVVPGWPQLGYSISSPAIADLDGDGTLEIALGLWFSSVVVFHQDGTMAAGWPQSAGASNIYGSVVLADLDGDGKLEVIVASETQLFAWHANGTAVAGFPITPGPTMHGSPAVGDLDGDGLPEIVIGTQDGRVFAWHHDGTPVAGWPQLVPGATEVSSAVSLGDIDGDGRLEVIAAGADAVADVNNQAIAWHADGTVVAGWPIAMSQLSLWPNSVGLGDVDGDGTPDVLLMPNDDSLGVYHANGTLLPGWPPAGISFGGYEFTASAPSVADLDGDGTMEVVAEGNGTLFDSTTVFKVYAFHHDGTALAGWPKTLPTYGNSSPAIGDIDGDGHADVLVGSDGIFVWSVPGTYDKNGAEWPTFRHDNRRTGTYQPKAGVVLLFDISGSMGLAPDGTFTPTVSNERISLAKQAAYPFLEEMNDFNGGRARFGIATFPSNTTPGCNGQVVTPMNVITDASKNLANTTTIPGLTPTNSTPLLAGMATAKAMLEGQRKSVIVLLTDGYHNCPTPATIGDPSVTALIASLNASGIRVFSIGFGNPIDPDYPLLEGFATQTTPPGAPSQFYDVTTPGFDPATWTPATALDMTYKSILVDALGLHTATDPLASIAGGASASHNVHLNTHDHRVSFFLSWKTPQAGRLGLTVKASDGTIVPAAATGVRVHLASTYAIVTLDSRYLSLPGKLGSAPWSMQVKASGVPAGQSEPYQYSVIVDSALRFDTRLGAPRYFTGDKMLVTVKLTEEGKKLASAPKVYMEVARPSDGLGNWLSSHNVTPQQLKQVPEKKGSEPMQPFQRKATYLREIARLKTPEPVFANGIAMYDDGTHGDVKAGDGIYSAVVDAPKAGTYTFHLHATGNTAKAMSFDRDHVVQTQVAVKALPQLAKVDVARAGVGRIAVAVKPRDALGNLLGPGHASHVTVTVAGGKSAAAIDLLDGRYVIEISLAPEPPPEVALDVRIDGWRATVKRPVLDKLPGV